VKRLLILGAAFDQVPLIVSAKEEGYYVVVCDNTTTNPGLSLVDKHYHVNYMERDEVLEVARKEDVNGIISNSEPAMPIVAYVSEKLGLIGNLVESVEMLADKSKFRELQESLGLYTPKHQIVNSAIDAVEVISRMSLPVLVKACECSATRGTFKITEYNKEEIKVKFLESASFSWNKKVAIEEYVEMPCLTTYEGDVFINGDIFLWDGLFYTQRSSESPMIPMTYSGPLDFEDKNIQCIKETLTKIFRGAGIKHGQYNVELYFTANGKPFVIEVNTRQGGRSLPKFIKQYCGIDFTKLLVTTAVGDNNLFNDAISSNRSYRYISHHLMFGHKEGKYGGFEVARQLQDKVIYEEEVRKKGEYLRKTINGTDNIGCVDFEFSSKRERDKFAFNMEKFVNVLIN